MATAQKTVVPAAPPPGARGRMTFSVQRLPQSLLLDQAVLDPTWNTFKTVMVFLGGMAIMSWIVWFSFQLGANGFAPATRRIVSPTSVNDEPVKPTSPAINIHVDGEVRVAPAVPLPAPTEPAELSPEELDRRHSEYLRSHDR